MPEIEIRHTLECDVDTYWKCVFDDEYNRRLYMDVLKFRECTTLSNEDCGGGATKVRKLHLNPPPADLPAPVAKVIGDLWSDEEGTFDTKTKRYRFKVRPASMPDKTTIEGEIWCEARGDKKCERIAKSNIEVKIFMVGGIVEKRIEADMRKSYEAAVKFTNDYVKEKGW